MRKFAIPSIISFVVNSLYNMVDQIFIGQGVGYLGNAATNVIMPIVTIMISLSLLLGDGTAAFMSLNLGKKEPEAAAKGVGNMVVLSVIVGVISLIMFEIFLEPVCRLFGATDTVLPYAMDYGRIIVLGFPFFVICSSFGSIIRADGRPKVSMIGLVLGCITNIILDPIFVLVFNWGVKGAAWATKMCIRDSPCSYEGGIPGSSHSSKRVSVFPVRLGEHRNPVPLCLQHPADNRCAKTGVVNICVPGYEEKVVVIPPSVPHVLAAHR